jgi:hypothetical protein
MMWKSRVLAILVVLALCRDARAERARPAQIRLDFGIASPVGIGGLVFAYDPSDHFEVEIGAGGGLTGLQLSLMGKATFGDRHRFTAGLGPSVGIGQMGTILDNNANAIWLNAEPLGYQFHADGGFTFALAAGVTVGLNDAKYCGLGSCDKNFAGFVFPSIRAGFGYSF